MDGDGVTTEVPAPLLFDALFQSKFVEELAQQGRIRELILDQYANYVVQRALTVANNEEGLKLVAAIRPHLHSMQVRLS